MRRGFTLIEMIITAAIVVILAAISLPGLLGGSQVSDLRSTSRALVASMRLAESQSVQEAQGMSWGIHLANPASSTPFYAVFSGTSYVTGTVASMYRLPSTVAFASSTLPIGSSTDVTFSVLSGLSSISTTFEFYLIAQPSLSSTISVASSGNVSAIIP